MKLPSGRMCGGPVMVEHQTPILEDAEAVYPCRCGETHQGPYAIHDYMHHNCLHPGPLVFLLHEVPGCENVHNVYCPTCGKTWEVTDDLR